MRWRFYIEQLDLTQTLVSEPGGWADTTLNFKRDADFHGIFFEYATALKFYGDGYEMIAQEYATNGVEGYLRLIIQFECGDHGDFETFYEARINFTKIEFDCSDVCLVIVPIEDDSCLSLLKNRQDQKVDLASLLSLDGDALADYSLPINVILSPKTLIILTNENHCKEEFLDAEQSAIPIPYDPNWTTPGHEFDIYFTRLYQIGFNNIVWNDAGTLINEFVVRTTFPDVTPLFSVTDADRSGNYFITIALTNMLAYFGGVSADNSVFLHDDVTEAGLTEVQAQIKMRVIEGGVTTDYVLYNDDDVSYKPPKTSCSPPDSATLPLNVFYTNTFAFVPGDSIRLYVELFCRAEPVHTNNVLGTTFDFCQRLRFLENDESDHPNYFKAELSTNNGTSLCNAVAVNEALSRTVESITNDCIRVKSDYFGRTDSLPYESDDDGKGSLEVLTIGLAIRHPTDTDECEMIDVPIDVRLLFSFNDVYNGLNAIHHLGMGLEPDTERGGTYQWLRVEPAKYFYNNSVVMVCDKVPAIQKKVISQEHFSIFNFGYAKWEAEEYNGLDEFCTKRSYRTTLQSVKNTLNQVCNLIASGYAIEITKGKGRTTKDWKYDNSQFIICMSRKGPYDNDFEVEQHNITSPANLIDPDTVYNFRISPNRNLLRWLWKLLASYVDPAIGKLIFQSGEANILAEGLLNSDPIEAAVLSESEVEVTSSTLATVVDAMPVYKLEEWSYRYPMSVDEYHAVKANPNGIIQVRYGQNEDFHDCYIRQIEYKPVKGEAQFTLLPKFKIFNDFGIAADYCIGDGAVLLVDPAGFEGGIFDGGGVTPYGGDYYFDPTTGVGVYTVTYTLGLFVATKTVTVHADPVVTIGPLPTRSVSDAPFSLVGYGNPEGGIFSGPGVTGDIFDSAAAGIGTHTISYNFTSQWGCSVIANRNIIVTA